MQNLYTFQMIIFRNSREIFIDVTVPASFYENALEYTQLRSKELMKESDKVTFALKSVVYGE